MPYKDRDKQLKYVAAYNLIHKKQHEKYTNKSSVDIFIDEYANDLDLEQLDDETDERIAILKDAHR